MRTTFDSTVEIRDAMAAARIREGYGQREKSQWICEAIIRLAVHDPTFSSVGLGEGRMKLTTKLAVSLTPDAQEVIRNAKTVIRREDPESEGLTGQIIRAAVRRRVERFR